MRELEDLADQASDSDNMWSLWYEFSDEFQPIPNPEDPTTYYFFSDSAAVKNFDKSHVWMVYCPWGQDLAEYSFITPCFSGDYGNVGDDGEGYIVTEKSWATDFDWTTSKYQSLEVRVKLSCECADEDPDCDICEGQGPAVISCLDIEQEE